MLDRDIILQKINSIQNCLTTISKATEENRDIYDQRAQIGPDSGFLYLETKVLEFLI